MAQSYQVILEHDAETDLWVTYVPALGYMSTYGETREDALEETREAIAGYLEAATKEGIDLPTEPPSVELADVEIEEP